MDLRVSSRRKGVIPISLAPPAAEYGLVYQPLRSTAPAPVAGTPDDPPVPATLNERATPGPRALVLRVSRTRIGAVGCSRPSPGWRVAPPLLVQPSTSATTLTSAPPA